MTSDLARKALDWTGHLVDLADRRSGRVPRTQGVGGNRKHDHLNQLAYSPKHDDTRELGLGVPRDVGREGEDAHLVRARRVLRGRDVHILVARVDQHGGRGQRAR